MPLIEKRYAEAFVDISISRGMLEAYEGELKDIVELYNTSDDLRRLLLNPEIRIEFKKDTLRRLFKDHISMDLLNFLQLLIDKGRVKYLPEILNEFMILADKHKNILNMTIISAAPLSDMQIESIKMKYKAIYNATSVKAEVEVDKSILGGIIVKIGDKVIDGSVKGRLENLQKLIIEA